MKLIKPSFEILEQGPTINDMYKHITRCGYTCYKTKKEITDESAKTFVEKMRTNGHLAMLEHGTVTMCVSKKTYSNSSNVKKIVEFLTSQHLWTKWFSAPNKDEKWSIFLITNYRVIVENGLQKFMEDYWVEDSNLFKFRPCVRIITDIGVGRELTRHKLLCVA